MIVLGFDNWRSITRVDLSIAEIPFSLCNRVAIGEFCLCRIYENFLCRFFGRNLDRIGRELIIEIDNIVEFWLSNFDNSLIFETDDVSKAATIFTRCIDREIDCKCSLIFKFIIDSFPSSEYLWAVWCSEPPNEIVIRNCCPTCVNNIFCFKCI